MNPFDPLSPLLSTKFALGIWDVPIYAHIVGPEIDCLYIRTTSLPVKYLPFFACRTPSLISSPFSPLSQYKLHQLFRLSLLSHLMHPSVRSSPQAPASPSHSPSSTAAETGGGGSSSKQFLQVGNNALFRLPKPQARAKIDRSSTSTPLCTIASSHISRCTQYCPRSRFSFPSSDSA